MAVFSDPMNWFHLFFYVGLTIHGVGEWMTTTVNFTDAFFTGDRTQIVENLI